MFWRVASFNQSSAVEAVLDRPDYTLEDLLEEDDLIQVRAPVMRSHINYGEGRSLINSYAHLRQRNCTTCSFKVA